MKRNLKTFGIGIAGGILPLAMFMMVYSPSQELHTDSYISDNPTTSSQNVLFTNSSGVPSEDFVSASEGSLNSVVHVTTKVVTTSVLPLSESKLMFLALAETIPAVTVDVKLNGFPTASTHSPICKSSLLPSDNA